MYAQAESLKKSQLILTKTIALVMLLCFTQANSKYTTITYTHFFI